MELGTSQLMAPGVQPLVLPLQPVSTAPAAPAPAQPQVLRVRCKDTDAEFVVDTWTIRYQGATAAAMELGPGSSCWR